MNTSVSEFMDTTPSLNSWCHSEPDQSDEFLIKEIVQRRPDALRSLYVRYETLVITVARNVLLDPDDAQETLQDVFLLIWNHAERFDPRRGKVKGWIGSMTHCRAIDRCRKRRRETVAREKVQEELAWNMSDHFHQIDRAAYFSEAGDDGRAVLHEAVACLPPEQMQVLLLTYMASMSQREIARHLGVTLGVVKHRFKKAMCAMTEMSDCLRGIFAI